MTPPSPPWQVSAIGAFDRFNYGDVLFAKVAEHMVEQHMPGAPIDFYALKASDLRDEGGVVTQPLSALYQKRIPAGQRHMVMLCGGELLAPTWAQMAEHLVPHGLSLQMKRVHSKTGHSSWTGFWRRFYGCRNLQPWTIDPDDLPDASQASVVYNAVGGTSTKALSPDELAWQTRALAKADWITVRDNQAAAAVAARGLNAPRTVPDSAVVMADLITPDQLREYRQKALWLSKLPDAPYLCVQTAERWARGHENELAEALRQVHADTGLNVLSFSIGRAAGHDDQVTSERLKDRLGDAPWFATLTAPLSVNETMALIAGSDAYVGSSLHGFITAFAFAVPRVGLMPHLGKLIGFRDAWDLPDMPAGRTFADIPQAVRQARLADKGAMQARAEAARDAYRASFSDMIAALHQDMSEQRRRA